MEIEFDGKAFGLPAVKRAAYRMSGRFTTDIRVEAERILCRFKAVPEGTLPPDLEHVFRAAVLDEDLREQIRTQTEPLRNAILALAFAPFQEAAEG